MSRIFDGFTAGSDQHITLAPGNVSSDGGPITILVYWQPDAAHASSGIFGGLITARASGSESWFIVPDGDTYFAPNDFSGFPLEPGEWQIIGYSKANGSAALQWHYWDAATGWTHDDGSTIGDQATPDAIWIGTFDGGRAEGLWVCAAVWNTALSGPAVEAAASPTALQDWFDASPAALWAGNQDTVDDPVTDLTGGGADETASLDPGVGGADPPGWSYDISTSEDHSGAGQAAGVILTPGTGTGAPHITGAGQTCSLTLTPEAGIGAVHTSGTGATCSLSLTPGTGAGTPHITEAGQTCSVVLTPGTGAGTAQIVGTGQTCSVILTPQPGTGTPNIAGAGQACSVVLTPGTGVGLTGADLLPELTGTVLVGTLSGSAAPSQLSGTATALPLTGKATVQALSGGTD